jgi:peptide/nickel transport system permease protein
MIFTLFVVSTLVFLMTQILPGNAAEMILGTSATPERIAAIERELGLNQPVYVQYFDWITGVLTGDWGRSYTLDRPVLDVILPRLLVSVQLALLSLLLVVIVAIPLGIIAALERDTPLDWVISVGSYVGISFPEFVTGTVLIYLFAGPVFNVFPSSGYTAPGADPVSWILHMILPAVTLMILLVAHVMRQTRSGMIEALQSEYVRLVRLKGMNERTVVTKHALRNALLPTITVLALDFGWLMGSLVIVEEIFAIPGLGRLVVFAIGNRDMPLIQMTVVLIAASYIIANFLADIAYSYLDPRIEYGES